jgi:hypothetical protein
MAEVVHENHLFPEFCPEDLNFRWFEPIYCDCGDERPLARTGFFFGYERLKANVSRAKEADGSQFGDWTTGNIFDFGYMRDADHHGQASGWYMSVLKMNNPNLRSVNNNIDRNGTILVDLQGNDIGEEFEQLNAFNVYGFEINRVWRMEPTFHGAILEPFIGVRYNRIRDHFDRADYELVSPVIPTVGPADGTLSFDEFDTYLVSENFTDNDLYGGQVGLRAFKQRGRWRIGTEVRGFAFHNFAERTIRARVEGNDRTVFALYDENGALTAIANGPLTGTLEVAETNDIKNRFSWGGELRLDLGFDITKKFSIELGGVFLAFADGIGRGDLENEGQSFISGGATLGFAINR